MILQNLKMAVRRVLVIYNCSRFARTDNHTPKQNLTKPNQMQQRKEQLNKYLLKLLLLKDNSKVVKQQQELKLMIYT